MDPEVQQNSPTKLHNNVATISESHQKNHCDKNNIKSSSYSNNLYTTIYTLLLLHCV